MTRCLIDQSSSVGATHHPPCAHITCACHITSENHDRVGRCAHADEACAQKMHLLAAQPQPFTTPCKPLAHQQHTYHHLLDTTIRCFLNVIQGCAPHTTVSQPSSPAPTLTIMQPAPRGLPACAPCDAPLPTAAGHRPAPKGCWWHQA